MCTFCSSTALMVAMADHLRKIGAASRFDVYSIKLSIQEGHFRSPLPFVTRDIGFEAVRIILCIMLPPIPTNLAVVRYDKVSTVLQLDRVLQLLHDLGDDFIFFLF